MEVIPVLIPQPPGLRPQTPPSPSSTHLALPQSPNKPTLACSPANPFFLAPRVYCPPAQPAPAPRSPDPWLWRCHGCGTTCRLACTRRCLACGHVFCTTRDRRGRMCFTEFDYVGWAAYGVWKRAAKRRRGLVVAFGQQSTGEDGEDVVVEQEKGGCFAGCDWPSHCRYRARERFVSPMSGVEAHGGWEEGDDLDDAEVDYVKGNPGEAHREGDLDEDGDVVMILWCEEVPQTVDPRLLALGGDMGGN